MYQSVSKQNDAQQQPSVQQAYVLTEIENRPPVNFDIPHPPLQTVYPKSIQNNIESRVVNRPTLQRQHSASSSIPPSLPSIVHEPSNTVATIQNIPATYASSLNDAQRYGSPIITSTYSNRESFSNSAAREKVVVKVVKAPGWYLNDANERKSYFDAVAHGLLSDNGLVYVNNVQKENAAQLVQNVPINFNPSNILPSMAFSQTQTTPNQSPSVAYSSKNIIPPALLQSQSQYTSGNNPTQFNGINYWPPCAYAQPSQVTIPQLPQQIQTQSRYQKRSSDNNDPYSGSSSYDVDSQSVGDGNPHQYNFASLRQPTA